MRCGCHGSIGCSVRWAYPVEAAVEGDSFEEVAAGEDSPAGVVLGLEEGILRTAEVAGSIQRQHGTSIPILFKHARIPADIHSSVGEVLDRSRHCREVVGIQEAGIAVVVYFCQQCSLRCEFGRLTERRKGHILPAVEEDHSSAVAAGHRSSAADPHYTAVLDSKTWSLSREEPVPRSKRPQLSSGWC